MIPKKVNRISRLESKVEKLTEEREKKEMGRRKFKVPYVLKKLSRQSIKKPDYVLVQYLTLKQQVEFKLCRIIGGDVIAIDNKAHNLDPRDVWRHKKHLWYIIREIDRQPVSNRDYEEVKKRKDDTEADVPLLKLVFGAINKSSNPLKNSQMILWVIGLAVAGVVAFVVFGGSA